MIGVVFLGLLACVAAAPQFPFDHPPPHHDYHHDYHGDHHQDHHRDHHHDHSDFMHQGPDYFQGNQFDTNRFWGELSSELATFDRMLQDFYKHFPSSVNTEGIKGNNYIITIHLDGFDESDVIVKAREGVVMVQAAHKFAASHQQQYLDVRSLPSYVNPAGNWTFEKGVLTITFPINAKPVDAASEETTETETEIFTNSITEEPTREVEAVDVTESSVTGENIEVGLEGESEDRRTDTMDSNTIEVEATTYSVDLNNEVEFVPVRY